MEKLMMSSGLFRHGLADSTSFNRNPALQTWERKMQMGCIMGIVGAFWSLTHRRDLKSRYLDRGAPLWLNW